MLDWGGGGQGVQTRSNKIESAGAKGKKAWWPVWSVTFFWDRKHYGEKVKPTGSCLLGATYWELLTGPRCISAGATQPEPAYIYIYVVPVVCLSALEWNVQVAVRAAFPQRSPVSVTAN